jgi:hypothetical protein
MGEVKRRHGRQVEAKVKTAKGVKDHYRNGRRCRWPVALGIGTMVVSIVYAEGYPQRSPSAKMPLGVALFGYWHRFCPWHSPVDIV